MQAVVVRKTSITCSDKRYVRFTPLFGYLHIIVWIVCVCFFFFFYFSSITSNSAQRKSPVAGAKGACYVRLSPGDGAGDRGKGRLGPAGSSVTAVPAAVPGAGPGR